MKFGLPLWKKKAVDSVALLFFFFPILQELQKHGSPGIVMVLVGNKADLHDNRSVSSQVRVYAHCHLIGIVLMAAMRF
jgi:hypothetical protein